MQLSERDFLERYRALSTDELLQIHERSDLIPVAKNALHDVLQQRGVVFDEFSVTNRVNGDQHGARDNHERSDAAHTFTWRSLWMFYFIFLLVASCWGIRIYLSDRCAPFTTLSCSEILMYFVGSTDIRVGRIQSALLVALHVLALYGCYCFIQHRRSFTRLFWQLFATFFIGKFVLGLTFLATNDRSDPFVKWYVFNAAFYIPLLVAIGLYAFSCRTLWGEVKQSVTTMQH